MLWQHLEKSPTTEIKALEDKKICSSPLLTMGVSEGDFLLEIE